MGVIVEPGAKIEIPAGPRPFFVKWTCRRCGATGFGRTTMPVVTREWTEPMMRNLLDSCRVKMAAVHMRKQECIATAEDMILERGAPEDAKIVGLV